MPPRGGSPTTPNAPSGAPSRSRSLPEFIDNDLYGSLVADAIRLGGEVLRQQSHHEGRQPSIADQVADQMVVRAAAQLSTYHGLGEAVAAEQ